MPVVNESKCGGAILRSNKKYGENKLDAFVNMMMHEPSDLVDHTALVRFSNNQTQKMSGYLI